MRNDVKLGLAVGGVLLAVLIVYVLVVPGAEQGGAELVTTVDGVNEPSEPVIKPEVIDSNKADQTPAAKASVEEVPPAPPAATAPDAAKPQENEALAKADATDPFAPPKDAPAAKPGGYDWNKLLNGDTPPTLLTPTDVPTDAPAQSSSEPAVAPPPMAQSPEPATASPPAPEPPHEVTGSTSPAPGAPGSEAGRTHVVQKGETLSSISAAAYGNPNYYPHILRANPNLDPNRMKPGTTINLPPASEVKPAAVAQAPAASPAASASKAPLDPTKQYLVQSGDSLERISIKLYGTRDRFEKLYEINKQLIGADPARIKVGQVLTLPEPPSVASAQH